jgi:hypothetical protein
MRILLNDIKAVSDAENIADKVKHTINVTIFHDILGSKNCHPPRIKFCFNYSLYCPVTNKFAHGVTKFARVEM